MSDAFTFPTVKKWGATMPISLEILALNDGFQQKGHYERVVPTPEQIAQHARAVALGAEIETNPYVSLSGYDCEVEVNPLERRRWVFDETHEEWLERYRAWKRSPQ